MGWRATARVWQVALASAALLSTSCTGSDERAGPRPPVDAGAEGGLDAGGGDTGRDATDHYDGGEVPVDDCEFGELAAATIEVNELYVPDYAGGWLWTGCVSAWVWPEPRSRIHGIGPFHRVALERGACRYLELAYGYCEPPCEAGELCAADHTCKALWVDGVSAGTLTITGTTEPVTLEPGSGSGYINGYYDECQLPPDLFAAGDPIEAAFAGDEFPAVSLVARGVESIDTDLAGVFVAMRDGEDLQLTWTAGRDPDACVDVIINGHNDGHGLPLRDIIHCVGPDTGSLTVAHELFEPFPPGRWYGDFSGVSCQGMDCIPSELSRLTRRVGEVDTGPVELRVRSVTYFGWDHVP